MNAFVMDVQANSSGDIKTKLLIAFQLPDDWKMDVNIWQWCSATAAVSLYDLGIHQFFKTNHLHVKANKSEEDLTGFSRMKIKHLSHQL